MKEGEKKVKEGGGSSLVEHDEVEGRMSLVVLRYLTRWVQGSEYKLIRIFCLFWRGKALHKCFNVTKMLQCY